MRRFLIPAALQCCVLCAAAFGSSGANAQQKLLLTQLRGFAEDGVLDEHGSLVSLTLRASAADDDLERIKRFSSLERLNLTGTQITDQGLKAVGELTSLQWLMLNDTAVTDAGLTHLRNLRQLKQLWLVNTRLTGAGLDVLSALPRLEELHLSCDTFTDYDSVYALSKSAPDLEILPGLPPNATAEKTAVQRLKRAGATLYAHADGQVRLASLSTCVVTDELVDALLALPSLNDLFLDHVSISQQQFAALGGCPTRTLSIMYSEIDDRYLGGFKKLQGVTNIYLCGTRITHAGIEELRGHYQSQHREVGIVAIGGGSLGVSLSPGEERCVVREVDSDTAAEAAGIRAGDVIVTFDGEAVTDSATLVVLVSARRSGDMVHVRWQRGEVELSNSVRLGERPAIRP